MVVESNLKEWSDIAGTFLHIYTRITIHNIDCVKFLSPDFKKFITLSQTKFKIMRLMLSILLMSESDEEEKEVEEESEKNKVRI